MKKGDVGMAKRFLSMETRDELHYLKSEIIAMSRCLSVPDATSLHHCLKNKQLKLILVSAVRIQVFSIKHS